MGFSQEGDNAVEPTKLMKGICEVEGFKSCQTVSPFTATRPSSSGPEALN